MVSKPALREMGNTSSWFFPIWDIYTDVLMSDGYAGHALNNQDATHSVTYLTHFLSIHYAPGTVLSPGDTEVNKKTFMELKFQGRKRNDQVVDPEYTVRQC